MSVVTIQDFSGMMPLRDALLLPDRNAQYAKNTWLYKGAVRGFRQAAQVYVTKYSDTQQVYRIPESSAEPPDFLASKWLEFPDPYMAVIRNPVVGDQWNRYYFFPSDQYNSTGANPDWPVTRPPPQYRTYDPATNTVGPLLVLGIPTPADPPIVVPAPTTTTKTATAAAPPGSTSLTLNNTTDLSDGMSITDTSLTTVTHILTAGTAPSDTNPNVLVVDDVTGILIGMTITNNTNPSGLIYGTSVTNIVGLNVTMSQDVASSGVAAGDSIKFQNIAFPVAATIDTNGVVNSTTVNMNAPTAGAGVLVGDQIEFDVTDIENRAYVYTYVSAYGEEGPASQPTNETGNPTGTWQITIPAPDPTDTTNRNLAKIRLYRTVVDASGNAAYYQVTEFPWTTGVTNYSDSFTPLEIVNNSPLTTELFTPPPTDLQGVVMMANGIAAGWSNDREIWFSAAYLPHAWPASYALTVDFPVVGLTANGASLNIMCKGSPFIATGVTPDTMTIGKISSNEPCIARGSVVSSGEGAYYASPNGVILLNSTGTMSITEFVYEKEFHNSLQPWNWAAGHYGLNYVAFIKGAGLAGVDPDGLALHGFVLDKEDKNTPFCYLHFSTTVDNMYFDEISGQLFELLSDGKVMQWNPPIANPGTTTLWDWMWKSKQFRMAFPASFKAIKIIFEVPPEVTITPGVRNTDQNQIFNPATQWLIVRVFADGRFVMVKEVQQNEEILKIPDGFKATLWELELQGQVNVKHLKMATSVKELRKA
jgi:hypothetical protein